jgi:hypothetical protein
VIINGGREVGEWMSHGYAHALGERDRQHPHGQGRGRRSGRSVWVVRCSSWVATMPSSFQR